MEGIVPGEVRMRTQLQLESVLPIKWCLCGSEYSVYLHLSQLSLYVCVYSTMCAWCSVWRCLSTSLAVCNLEPVCSCCFFFPPFLIPPLAPLKWQFVKHGPPLALSLASQPFPARLLPSLICPPPLLFTSLVFNFLPSLSLLSPLSLLISIPPVHSASLAISLSLPVYSPLSFCLSLSHFPVVVHMIFLLHYLYLFVHCCDCTLIISSISLSCTFFNDDFIDLNWLFTCDVM